MTQATEIDDLQQSAPTEHATQFARRRFLQSLLANAAAAPLWQGSSISWGADPSAATPVAGAAPPSDAAQLVPGKSPALIVHNGTPLEIETPLELLREHAITPTELLFVRNNGGLADSAKLEPTPLAGWSIEVSGLVEFPRKLDAARLAELPLVEHEMVLQCSGNGRKFFSEAAKVKGSPWCHGGMGNVRFRGVPLRAVLDELKCQPHEDARFLTAEGHDTALTADKADFEHSIPLDDALDRSLLAIELNGKPIPAVHGGPVRLITPGYYATMNVKWLSRLRLEGQETPNYNQVPRYRTPRDPIAPGTPYVNTLKNSDPNWRLRTKSVIFAPLDGEQIAAGDVAVRGVAFNDGRARIEAVELSIDDGQSWRRAQLAQGAGPYAWQPWSATISLPAGEQHILARAVDALGRTQPLDAAAGWNPDGYAWHNVHRVTVHVA
jgi:DMSO/TMAO reductase YedYZ molybdopterin-dependent catalytic subunit